MGLKNLYLSLQFCCLYMAGYAQTGVEEANLKAAFIYNFTKYIDWNEYNNKPTFIIGIIGSSPVMPALKEIAETNQVKDKPIELKFFDDPANIEYCHILYIPHQLSYPLSSVLAHARKGMLTISDTPGFAVKGTAFNFIKRNGRLKFEANLKALNDADIKAGSQLLKLAQIVN
jgi:hypothetical protein